jgi:lipid-A-disaccharide synthase
VVGEASGDLLAADLISRLPSAHYKPFGICGPRMITKGNCQSIFPMEDLSVNGYTEVLPKFFLILYRFIQTLWCIYALNPDVIVTVDSPGFNFPLVKTIRRFLKLKAKIIHYVAPTVWAYQPERAKVCARLYDHMMVILPFEKKYFLEVGLKCDYVGNPAFNQIKPQSRRSKKLSRKTLSLPEDKILVCLFPGSRKSELVKHLPIIKNFIDLMNKKYSNMVFFIPSVLNGKIFIQENLYSHNVLVAENNATKELMLDACDLIIAKSGTSVTESICKLIPVIMFYKVSNITAWFIKRQIKVKYFTICNIVMGQPIIPELLQEDFNSSALVHLSEKLIFNKIAIKKQIQGMSLYKSKFYELDKNPKLSEDIIIRYCN